MHQMKLLFNCPWINNEKDKRLDVLRIFILSYYHSGSRAWSPNVLSIIQSFIPPPTLLHTYGGGFIGLACKWIDRVPTKGCLWFSWTNQTITNQNPLSDMTNYKRQKENDRSLMRSVISELEWPSLKLRFILQLVTAVFAPWTFNSILDIFFQ